MSLVTDAINEQRCTISELPQLCSMLHSRVVVVVVVFLGRCDPSNLPHAPPLPLYHYASLHLAIFTAAAAAVVSVCGGGCF